MTHNIKNNVHWLEQLHLNLDELSPEERDLAFSLLTSPWKCNPANLVQYVPHPLNDWIIEAQKSVLRHVFGKHKIIPTVALSNCAVIAHVQLSDGAIRELLPNTLFAAETYISIAKEDLASIKRVWGNLNGSAQASLLTLYALCETAFHVISKMLVIKRCRGNSLVYQIPSNYQAAKKVMWCSRYWTQLSLNADTQTARMIFNELKKRPSRVRSHSLFEAWIDSVLDKYFSLHWRYIPADWKSTSGVLNELRRRIELICFIWLQTFENTSLDQIEEAVLCDRPLGKISYLALANAGFETEEIRYLLAESLSNPPGDQFVTESETGLVMHSMLLKYAVQKYGKSILDRKGTDVGKWFDSGYINTYLKDRLDESRFVIGPEMKDEKLGYDADLVIYDKSTRIFYFCQIKHRSEVMQPYLRDELYEYRQNKNLHKGFKQLSTLRTHIESKSVHSRLVGRFGKKVVELDPLSIRSRYLLIHTIENFDMTTYDGIAMYEWNTFRNLLQGIVFQGTSTESKEFRYSTLGMDFSDIHTTQSYLMDVTSAFYKSVGISPSTPSDEYELSHRAQLSLHYQTVLWLKDYVVCRRQRKHIRIPLL
jgi:hypothetical protein